VGATVFAHDLKIWMLSAGLIAGKTGSHRF